MALISIPTSIGGITIPGLNKGPLGSLFNNPFSTSSLQYPMDLTAANKNHFVRFDIREVQSAEISNLTNGESLLSEEGLTNLGRNATAKIKEFGKAVFDPAKTFSQNLNPELKPKPVATVLMYMPDSIEFQSSINYNDDANILDIATNALSAVGGKLGEAISSAVKSSTAQIALKKFGYAINPQVQLLFQSIDFREYSMSFTFTPNSREEAANIQKIIKTFRAWSLPQVVADTKGMFYRPPAVFDVSFYSNGSENRKINRIKQSVIKNVDVNYAPNGWSAHNDGAPVQTTMTLQLQETVLIDRDEVLANGY